MYVKYHLLMISSVFFIVALQVFFMLIILFVFSVGVYSNLYIYKSFNWTLIISACFLPYGGYICGALLAWIFRLDWKLIKVGSLL